MTFYLNYTVFLHDCIGNYDDAVKYAKNAIFSAIKDLDGDTGNEQKDIILLCQMIKDNLSLWKNGINQCIRVKVYWDNFIGSQRKKS